jgi:hypothetical protein
MCSKNGSKAFYILFRALETSKPVQIFSKQNHVYKSLEVFNRFPNPNEVAHVMKKNVVDGESVKLMKIEIPYSILL